LRDYCLRDRSLIRKKLNLCATMLVVCLLSCAFPSTLWARENVTLQGAVTLTQQRSLPDIVKRIQNLSGWRNTLVLDSLLDVARPVDELAQSHNLLGIDNGALHDKATLACLLAYINLAKINVQLDILKIRDQITRHLLLIESERILDEVDDPSAMYLAKLSRARAELKAAELEPVRYQLLALLSALTGLEQNKIEPVLDSIPTSIDTKWVAMIANDSTLSADEHRLIEELRRRSFGRDQAQAEECLAFLASNKMEVASELGRVGLGSDELGYVSELEKLDAFVQVAFQVESTEAEFFQKTHKLSAWLSGVQSTVENGSSADSFHSVIVPFDIAISPAISKIQVGQSVQLYAFVIDEKGRAADKSSDMFWSVNTWNAVISDSGLITALTPGRVMVSVSYSGTTETLSINVQAPSRGPQLHPL